MKFKVILYFVLSSVFIFSNCTNSKKKYRGAELFSKDSVKYGKFEIRMKMAAGSGIISSFFLFATNSWRDAPYEWKEIDIEALGCGSDLLQTNIITGFKSKQIVSKSKEHIEKSLSAGYNIYSLEWAPDYLAWYVNRKLIRKTLANENKQVADLRNKYMSYRFNIWITDRISWNGIFNEKSLPAHLYIDWIRYYTYNEKETPRFKLAWADEFDVFDTNRWDKGDWTFEGNKAIFHPTNVSVANNNAVLALTIDGNIGSY